MMYSAAAAPAGRLKGVMSMATLAANLFTKGYGPVQDATGLPGKYDIDLRWSSNNNVEPNTASDADLGTALRESLGWKLERRNVKVQFLVIDYIERIPADNYSPSAKTFDFTRLLTAPPSDWWP